MNRKIYAFVGIVLFVAIAGVFALSTKNQDSSPIRIGFIGPLTGDLANVGENAKAAVEIARDEINESGGIKGRPLEIVFEDTKCDSADAASAANKLTSIDHVPVVIGGLCSGETIAAAPIMEKSQTILLSYCSTNPSISDLGEYIFRSVPSDTFQGRRAAALAYNDLHKRNAAVVYINNDGGNGVRNSFKTEFIKLGGSIVVDEAYDPESKDLRTQLMKVKNSRADFLYFSGQTDSTIAGLKQAKELGLQIQLMGSDAWDDGKIWSELGSIGNGALFTTVGSIDSQSFKEKMRKKIGTDMLVYCSNYAYDNVRLVAQIMKEVGTNQQDIKNALYKTVYTEGVGVNPLQFDSHGDPVNANYVVKIVKDGKAEILPLK